MMRGVSTERVVTRRSVLATLGVVGAGAALAGCSDGKPKWNSPGGAASDGAGKDSGGKAKVSISQPAHEAKDVPAGLEIVFTATDATSTQVSLKDDKGTDVPGAMHPDGAGWLPAAALQFGATYTATVTATGDDGKTSTATSTFTTMAKPDKVIGVTSYLGDGAVVGVGMPMVLRLSQALKKEQRAALQRRLMVTTEPVQEGVWIWYTDTELHWRPKEFWQAGTKIRVDARAGGLPLGDGFYGKKDLAVDVKIGPSLILSVDDTASPKVMKVTKDGQVIKTIPVSLGKPTMPSSSGTTVIMERFAKTVFDTMDNPDPANRYRTDIQYAQRLTYKGEFIHAAPWSDSAQGNRNVSRGCINMSVANSKWLFEQTMLGVPVITKGTPRPLAWGNGWTDWNKSWDEYVKGSAIPYKPNASPSPSTPPSPSTSPSAGS
jgi:lipoprotein-anchoring transpeptidase ErfK/SrfK